MLLLTTKPDGKKLSFVTPDNETVETELRLIKSEDGKSKIKKYALADCADFADFSVDFT